MADTRRPWLAALLAVFYPGLGHAYLREWLRAFVWFALAIATAVLVIPPEALDVTSVSAFLDSQSDLPLSAALALTAVSLFSVVDAYLLAAREAAAPADGPGGEATESCPNCGRDIEDELDFCHWCTEPLVPTTEE